MEPIQANAPFATQAAAAQQAAQNDSRGLINSDFQTFLTMLTTQMQNQDPLNPMESTDFATQLATFSGVEQQVRSNELLERLEMGLNMMGMGEISGWVGMEARADMPVLFTGQPITMAAPPHNLADRMELVVTDQSGTVVQRLNIPVSDEPFAWAGVAPDGTPFPPGVYTFSTAAYAGEDLLETSGARVYAMVEEAQRRGEELWLLMGGGVSVPAGAVEGVRSPGALR